MLHLAVVPILPAFMAILFPRQFRSIMATVYGSLHEHVFMRTLPSSQSWDVFLISPKPAWHTEPETVATPSRTIDGSPSKTIPSTDPSSTSSTSIWLFLTILCLFSISSTALLLAYKSYLRRRQAIRDTQAAAYAAAVAKIQRKITMIPVVLKSRRRRSLKPGHYCLNEGATYQGMDFEIPQMTVEEHLPTFFPPPRVMIEWRTSSSDVEDLNLAMVPYQAKEVVLVAQKLDIVQEAARCTPLMIEYEPSWSSSLAVTIRPTLTVSLFTPLFTSFQSPSPPLLLSLSLPPSLSLSPFSFLSLPSSPVSLSPPSPPPCPPPRPTVIEVLEDDEPEVSAAVEEDDTTFVQFETESWYAFLLTRKFERFGWKILKPYGIINWGLLSIDRELNPDTMEEENHILTFQLLHRHEPRPLNVTVRAVPSHLADNVVWIVGSAYGVGVEILGVEFAPLELEAATWDDIKGVWRDITWLYDLEGEDDSSDSESVASDDGESPVYWSEDEGEAYSSSFADGYSDYDPEEVPIPVDEAWYEQYQGEEDVYIHPDDRYDHVEDHYGNLIDHWEYWH